MKSAYGSLLCPTLSVWSHIPKGSLSRWGITGAPCRNRTCNLMIKSQIRASLLARTGAVQLAPHASKLVELVPQTYPNRARSFHDNSPTDLLYLGRRQ